MPTRPLPFLAAAGLWALAACATTKPAAPAPAPDAAPPTAAAPAPKPPTDEERKQAMVALFAREQDASGPQSFALGELTLTTESAQPVKVTRNEAQQSTTIVVGLGGQQPVNCFLYDVPVDTGGLVTRLVGSLKGSFQVASVRPYDVTVVEKAPAVFIEVAYLTTKGEKRAGHLKLMVYANEAAPLACLHDEPGYPKTFQRVATSLARALGQAGQANPDEQVTFRAVSVLRVKGMPLGFERVSWAKDKAGVRSLETVSAMFVPRSAQDLLARDSVTLVTLDKDGAIKDKVHVAGSNGEIESRMVLKRTKGGTYGYEGTQQGKALSGTVKTADGKGLVSDVGIAKQVKTQLLSGKKATLSLEEYASEVDPTVISKTTYTKGAAPQAVTMELGPMRLEATMDASGLPERAELQTGPVTIEQQRVFVEGTPE